MFDILNLSACGKEDFVPVMVVLAVGLLWATFVPDRTSDRFGLRVWSTAIGLVVVYIGATMTFLLDEAGYHALSKILGWLTAGFAIGPSFRVTPPAPRRPGQSGVYWFFLDRGNAILDKTQAKLVIAIAAGLLPFLKWEVTVWATAALAGVLLTLKVGKAQSGPDGRVVKINALLLALGFFGTVSMVSAFIVLTGILTDADQQSVLSLIAALAGILVAAIL